MNLHHTAPNTLDLLDLLQVPVFPVSYSLVNIVLLFHCFKEFLKFCLVFA